MPYLEYDKVDEKTARRMRSILEKSYAAYWKKKRTFDVIVTGLLLALLILPMLLLALIIWLTIPTAARFINRCASAGTENRFSCINSAPCMWTRTNARQS